TDAALVEVEKRDLSALQKFLTPHYGARDLSNWARAKFGIELSPESIDEMGPEKAAEQILHQAREAYRRREIAYPVEYALDYVLYVAQQDQNQAIEMLVAYANQRYEAGWTPEQVSGRTGKELHDELVELAEAWVKP